MAGGSRGDRYRGDRLRTEFGVDDGSLPRGQVIQLLAADAIRINIGYRECE